MGLVTKIRLSGSGVTIEHPPAPGATLTSVGDADGQDGGYPYRTVDATNMCAHRIGDDRRDARRTLGPTHFVALPG
jgi:hypothetical protein